MVLREGDEGRARITIRGKGESLGMPALPLRQDPNVTLQLSNDTGCWQSSFSTNRNNDSRQFWAKSD
jgi:hypothetical protein